MGMRDGDVTALLERWRSGEAGLLPRIVPLVYADLRRLAARSLRGERADHTLQPTALVHEAYLRLAGSQPPALESRDHFLCMAARLMRQILVDHSRRAGAAKRGGDAPRISLDDVDVAAPGVDLVALDLALDALEARDPRKARVIELRFFGGFEVREVARLLDISVPTVVADTRFARAWLLARIDHDRADGRPAV